MSLPTRVVEAVETLIRELPGAALTKEDLDFLDRFANQLLTINSRVRYRGAASAGEKP